MAGATHQLEGNVEIGEIPLPRSEGGLEMLLARQPIPDDLAYSATSAHRLIPASAKSIRLISPTNDLFVVFGNVTAKARQAVANNTVTAAWAHTAKTITLAGQTYVADGVVIGDFVWWQQGSTPLATDPQYFGMVASLTETVLTLEAIKGYPLGPGTDMADIDPVIGFTGTLLLASVPEVFPIAPVHVPESDPMYVAAIVASGSATGTLNITSFV